MTALRVVLVSTLVLGVVTGAGCRSRRYVARGVGATTAQTPTDRRTSGVEVARGIVAQGTPRQQLDQYDRVMRQAGYEPVGPAARGELSAERPIAAFPIDVQRGYCYALAAFGAPGSDVNMFVLDPMGRDASHNVLPDEHPWTSFCAARGGRFIVRLQLARGAGEFFFAPYHARGGRPVNLASFFGGSARPPQTATLDAQVRSRLAVLDRTLAAERFARVGEPQGAVLAEREEQTFRLSLQRRHCYAFASLAGRGATDTDLVLVDGTGRTVELDQSAERDALVRFCAPDTSTYRLQVRLPSGSGPVFTVAYARAPEAGAAAGEAAASSGGEPVLAEASGGGLEENFALLDADMRARGYEGFSTSQSGQLPSGGHQDFPIDLEADKCYALIAVGDGGVRTLSLALLDPTGREVDRDDADGSRPAVRACVTRGGRYAVRVAMANGQGNFMLGTYRWTRPTAGPFNLRGLALVRLSEMTTLLETEAFQFDTDYEPQQGRLRTEGSTATHRFDLQGGRCYAILVVGGEGVRDIDASLSNASREIESDTTTRGGFVSLRHCTRNAQALTLTVRATQGAGTYVVQVYSAPNGASD